MSVYTPWSVTALEVPNATKWNLLGGNDASFNDGDGIADDAIVARHISGFDKSNLTADVNPYKFRAYSNTTQNSGNGAFAVVALNTENFDSNSNFASNTYTVPVSGFYLVGGRIHTTSNPTRLIVTVYKNGTEVARGDDISDDDAQLAGSAVSVSSLLQLTAGDTIDMRSFGNTTLVLVGGSDLCYFWGVLLSRT